MLAHEFIRASSGLPAKETILFFHGLLGRKTNLRNFAKRCLVSPHVQALLVDLRGHGDSARIAFPPPHTLPACREDVQQLISALMEKRELDKPPSAIVGHSFGGKLALEYYFSNQSSLDLVWVLDSSPGVINYFQPHHTDQQERESVVRLMRELNTLPLFHSKSEMVQLLLDRNFSPMVANWMTTNVIQHGTKLSWMFDLDLANQLFADYSARDYFPQLEEAGSVSKVHFLCAGRNTLLWTPEVRQRIDRLPHVHWMPQAGHFLHAVDPEGVVQVLKDSLHRWIV